MTTIWPSAGVTACRPGDLGGVDLRRHVDRRLVEAEGDRGLRDLQRLGSCGRVSALRRTRAAPALSTPSASSISGGSFSRSRPTTSVRGGRRELVGRARPRRAARRPRRCAPRRAARAAGCPTTSSRPGDGTVANASATTSSSSGRADETPPPRRARSRRCRPGARRASGRNTSGYCAVRRVEVDEAPTEREPVARAHRSRRRAATTARGSRCEEDRRRARDRSRRARACAPGFTMPAFSVAMSARASGRGTRRGRCSRW